MDKIIPFAAWTLEQREEAAVILHFAFARMENELRDMGACRKMVAEFHEEPERVAFALMRDGVFAGWIGAIPAYSNAWELHPLAVTPRLQRQGVGSRLLQFLEAEAAKARVGVIWLGSDDEYGGTNLYGADLFSDIAGAITNIEPTGGHPFTFYKKHGYAVTGVLPDANGPGKPDIFMAKKIGG